MFSEFGLHPLILKALRAQGLQHPTPVQQATIPLAMDHVDVQVTAATGSGKTLAYLLPAVQRLLSRANPHGGARALVLVPTRELAQQVKGVAQALTEFTRLRVVMLSGGEPIKVQAEQLQEGADIVVATTGRLLEHLEHDNIDFLSLDLLVLDEADRMLDMGFSGDVLAIAEACSPERQTLLLSATMNNKSLPSLAAKLLREPEYLDAANLTAQLPPIREHLVLCDEDAHKQRQLLWLLQHERYEIALIFANSRDKADHLCSFLAHHRQRVGVLHGEMEPSKRKRVMDLLREGKLRVLVATELAARGLDVGGINLVVNFEMPRRADQYTHRIGRTGRGGVEGLAINFVNAHDWNATEGIQRFLKRTFERRVFAGLEARFAGPKRHKPAVKKKLEKKANPPKVKKRWRDKVNVGKRRVPTAKKIAPSDA